MPRVWVSPDAAFAPAAVDVTAKMTAASVGVDSATVLVRRDALKALAASYRSAPTTAKAADLFDAMIAAGFDA